MKRHGLLFGVLLGTLLAAAPMSALRAQVNGTNVDSVASSDLANGRPVGVQFTDTDVKYSSSSTMQSVQANGDNTYGITGKVDITGDFSFASGSPAAVAATDSDGNYNFADGISIKSTGLPTEEHSLYGFLYANNAAFTGSISGEGDISSIISTGDGGAAYGVSFRSGNGSAVVDINTNGSIHFGSITADASQGTWVLSTATGFVAGTLQNGNVTLGSVTASGIDSAAGVELSGIDTNGSIGTDAMTITAAGAGDAAGYKITGNVIGTLKSTGAITVTNTGAAATDSAAGVLVGGTFSGTIDIAGTDVTSDGGWAAGITLENANGGDVTVSGTLEATSTNGSADGLAVVNGNLDNVNIGAIDVAAELDAHGVVLQGDLTTGTFGAITVTSSSGDAAGILGGDLGDITLTGDITATGNAAAAGVQADSANVTVSGDITVTGNGGNGFYVMNDLTMNILDNNTLETNRIDAGNAMFNLGDAQDSLDVTGETIARGDLTINGTGSSTADLGDLIVNDNKTANSNVTFTGVDVNVGDATINLGNTGSFSSSDQLNVGGDLRVTGTGNNSVDFGMLDLSSGNGTMTLEGVNATFTVSDAATNDYSDFGTGTKTLTNSTLTGDRDLTEDEVIGGVLNDILGGTGDWTLDSNSLIKMGALTEITQENGAWVRNVAAIATMNDGFLAAMMMHDNNTAWNAVRGHMISGVDYRPGYRGQDCGSCGPTFCGSLARNAWMNYVGRSDEYESSFAGRWKLSSEGVQFGTDVYRSNRSQFGLLFGYESGRTHNAGDRVENDDVYLGIYGAHVFCNGADLRGSFAYGWQDYDLAQKTGGAAAVGTASFKGYTLEGNVELGKTLRCGAWSLRPVLAVDVFNNNLDEARSRGGFTFAETDLTQVFLRTGADVRFQKRCWALTGGLYYAYDLNDEDLNGGVRYGNGGAWSRLAGTKPGSSLLTFDLGAEYQPCRNFTIFGGYRGENALDGDNEGSLASLGYLGGAFRW